MVGGRRRFSRAAGWGGGLFDAFLRVFQTSVDRPLALAPALSPPAAPGSASRGRSPWIPGTVWATDAVWLAKTLAFSPSDGLNFPRALSLSSRKPTNTPRSRTGAMRIFWIADSLM